MIFGPTYIDKVIALNNFQKLEGEIYIIVNGIAYRGDKSFKADLESGWDDPNENHLYNHVKKRLNENNTKHLILPEGGQNEVRVQ